MPILDVGDGGGSGSVLCGTWLDLDDPDDAAYVCCTGVEAQHVLIASSLLAGAPSGHQFPGLCTDSVRPSWIGGCWQFLAYAGGGSRPIAQAVGAHWQPIGYPTSVVGSDQGFGTRGGVHLPLAPVQAVTEVKVDGATLDASEYRLVNAGDLLRVEGSWPARNDLRLADTEEGTWSVTYTYGRRPDPAGLWAVGALACRIARTCSGEDGCLPQRLQSVVREGVSTVVLDPFDFLDDGRFGIEQVDYWLNAVNPSKVDRRARVLSHRDLAIHDRS